MANPTFQVLVDRVRRVMTAETDTGFFDDAVPGIGAWLNEGFRLQHEGVLSLLKEKFNDDLTKAVGNLYLKNFQSLKACKVAKGANVVTEAGGTALAVTSRLILGFKMTNPGMPGDGFVFRKVSGPELLQLTGGSRMFRPSYREVLWTAEVTGSPLFYFPTSDLTAPFNLLADMAYLKDIDDLGLLTTNLGANAPLEEKYCIAPVAYAQARMCERMSFPPDIYEDRFQSEIKSYA